MKPGITINTAPTAVQRPYTAPWLAPITGPDERGSTWFEGHEVAIEPRYTAAFRQMILAALEPLHGLPAHAHQREMVQQIIANNVRVFAQVHQIQEARIICGYHADWLAGAIEITAFVSPSH